MCNKNDWWLKFKHFSFVFCCNCQITMEFRSEERMSFLVPEKSALIEFLFPGIQICIYECVYLHAENWMINYRLKQWVDWSVVHPFTKQDDVVVDDDYDDDDDDDGADVGNILNVFLVRRPGAGERPRAHTHNKSWFVVWELKVLRIVCNICIWMVSDCKGSMLTRTLCWHIMRLRWLYGQQQWWQKNVAESVKRREWIEWIGK